MHPIPVQIPIASVALLLVAAFRSGSARRTQDDSSDDSPTALPSPLREMVTAVNTGDAAAVAALYADDSTHEDVPAGVVARGREEINAYVEGAFGQFGDPQFAPVFGRQAADHAVLEYVLSFTDIATGRPVSYRGTLVFELDGPMIRRSADYYDLAAILGQLGQLEAGVPAPAATPSP